MISTSKIISKINHKSNCYSATNRCCNGSSHWSPWQIWGIKIFKLYNKVEKHEASTTKISPTWVNLLKFTNSFELNFKCLHVHYFVPHSKCCKIIQMLKHVCANCVPCSKCCKIIQMLKHVCANCVPCSKCCKIIQMLKHVCANCVPCICFWIIFSSIYSLTCSSLLHEGQSTNISKNSFFKHEQSTNINKNSFFKHDVYCAYNVLYPLLIINNICWLGGRGGENEVQQPILNISKFQQDNVNIKSL